MLQRNLNGGQREVSRITISVYDFSGEFPTICQDLSMSIGTMPIMKAKATRLLYKYAKAPMEKWQVSDEFYPEHFRNAGDHQVRIHMFE